MAAPKFAPVAPLDDARGYESPDHVPDAWMPDRPGELAGRQPPGPRLGYQGPDQGYALTLAARLRPQLRVPAGERVDDAVAGCTAVALRRASLFGRAPVIHDLRIAFTIWGFLDGTAGRAGRRCAGRRSRASADTLTTTTRCGRSSTRCPRRRCG